MMKKIIHKQRGDTIIEVLLAMSVIGLSLAIAFGIANRATIAGRQAQERTQAVKLAESQLELLKSNLSNGAATRADYEDTAYYCITTSNPKVSIAAPPAPTPECIDIQGLYDIRIEYSNAGGVTVFKSVVLWDDPTRTIDGDEETRSRVELRYRP